MAYCQWRTDRVNEMALVKAGAIVVPPFADLQATDDEAYKDEWETATGYEMDSYEEISPEDPEETITMYRPSYEYIRDKFVLILKNICWMIRTIPIMAKNRCMIPMA